MMRHLSNSHPNKRIFSGFLAAVPAGDLPVSLARKVDGIPLGLRSWSCTTPTCLWLYQTDEIPQAGTVRTGGLQAFGRIVSVGESVSKLPTTVLILSFRGLALGRTVGETYRASAQPQTNCLAKICTSSRRPSGVGSGTVVAGRCLAAPL